MQAGPRLVLHGFRPSVYVRIARMVLEEKGVPYRLVEVDPFAPDVSPAYRDRHPFGRVPTLEHGDFVLYETAAITRYIDEAFSGPALQPAGPRARARMVQIIAVIDNYGYWPMVRQMFSHRVFRPRAGMPADAAAVREGLAAAAPVLAALSSLSGDGAFLLGDAPCLADMHLAPMLDYFTAAPEGAACLDHHPRLAAWWAGMAARPSLARCRDDLT